MTTKKYLIIYGEPITHEKLIVDKAQLKELYKTGTVTYYDHSTRTEKTITPRVYITAKILRWNK